MHPVYRQVIFSLISIISLIVSCNRCQQQQAPQGWTPQLESQVYDLFYSQSASLVTNAVAKKEYADCCLSKMKELFPNGISNVSSEMTDSVKQTVTKNGFRMRANHRETYKCLDSGK